MSSLCIPLILLLSAGPAALCLGASPQSSASPQALTPGKSAEGDLSGGQTHTYTISLKTGQYCRVVVAAGGIDLVLSVYSPSGELLAAAGADYPLTQRQASIVSGHDGDYHREMQSAGPTGRARGLTTRV